MYQITSQDGNVIAADFRTRAPDIQIDLRFKTDIIYADHLVCLIRIAYFWGDELIGVQHVMHDAASA